MEVPPGKDERMEVRGWNRDRRLLSVARASSRAVQRISVISVEEERGVYAASIS
jgi:hypothetical protein